MDICLLRGFIGMDCSYLNYFIIFCLNVRVFLTSRPYPGISVYTT